jgi:hypothetical protein
MAEAVPFQNWVMKQLLEVAGVVEAEATQLYE